MATKVFKGANVFMSRNLVPPELFDTLHDALKLNGAQVFLCCDPSRNGPNDYHVIASPEHEKFGDLRSKSCNLIGPQCVLSCAKEHRVLPNRGYTCCLALDGVNIVASGFEKDEKVDIEKMVTAMGGQLSKTSPDVSFVIVKDVLAQKYKWALNTLKKPIVSTNWLLQCWKEHRVVPQESYRVLPFSGLTICVSGIPADERKEIEKLVIQNGGTYSAELTKRCSHLISPEGDKYKVSKRWGHQYIVNKKWFHQSVARRACLIEESYPVQGSSSSSALKTLEQNSQSKGIRYSQCTSSSMPSASDFETKTSEVSPISKEGDEPPAATQDSDSDFARCTADDSQNEDDDLYLSECRILLVGFEASEFRKLVDMVRQGGGSRYVSVREKLTHVVVGNPSESEIKEIRSLAAFGVISIVKRVWLEECTLKKKEVPVVQSHIAYDLLLPKDSVIFIKATATRTAGLKHGKSSVSQLVDDNILENRNIKSDVLFGLNRETKLEVHSRVSNGSKHIKSSTVFKGKLFRFSSSFPGKQRPEIVLWINKGGGEVVDDQTGKNVHFIVESHGVSPSLTNSARITYVTTHWIYSCLEDGCLLDISSYILYSPLSCKLPLPGLEGYRLCVSQYDVKERKLLRNLCHVIGVKYGEKLTKKVTHLLCKFTDGDKFGAACRWGIHVATAEWVYACAMQNKVVELKEFYPKELTVEDRLAGSYSLSQYPTHSDKIISGDDATQHSSQLQDLSNMRKVDSKVMAIDEKNYSSGSKRQRLNGNDNTKHSLSCDSSIHNFESSKEVASVVPDVAAAIEDLLEQTSKIQDRKSQETSACHENFLSSDTAMLSQRHVHTPSDPGPSKHWTNRLDKGDDDPSAESTKGIYDGFSETQTDSQVVGYEEDLSGRQMIIDRVRTRSSMT
ncbi:hypothetical protein ACS0TY_003153 [Phlomoides rotata]